MTDPIFFPPRGPLTLAEIAKMTGAQLGEGADPDFAIRAARPLDLAGPHDLSFFNDEKLIESWRTTGAGACLVPPKFAGEGPAGMHRVVTRDPYRAYVAVVRALHEAELRPRPVFGGSGIDANAMVHPEARLEDGVMVDPGAVIGPGAEIGSGTAIAANAVIGPHVRIGRDCSIGAGATVLSSLIGDRVIVYAGAHIGQDGFGYVATPRGHMKVPQIGRVIIQDDVEIGAGTAIDRGSGRDTMIGEGTKIDNQVQIGHNVIIGRHCIIVAHVGISGSCTIGDHVIIAGKVGMADHVTVGDRARIGAGSGVMHDIPDGTRWMGYPARPQREFVREIATLRRLAAERPHRRRDGDDAAD